MTQSPLLSCLLWDISLKYANHTDVALIIPHGASATSWVQAEVAAASCGMTCRTHGKWHANLNKGRHLLSSDCLCKCYPEGHSKIQCSSVRYLARQVVVAQAFAGSADAILNS